MKNNRLLLSVVVLLGVVTATLQLLPSSQQTTSVETLPPTTVATSTIPVTTTSEPVASSTTTTPKRQATTTVPTAPKKKTPVITGTPSEILDKLRADVLAMERQIMSSGDFGSYSSRVEALSVKYSGSATLVRNRSVTAESYTAKSGDLTQVWFVEFTDAELILVER